MRAGHRRPRHLLDPDGFLEQEGGDWIKIEARRAAASEHPLHGIGQSLTPHVKHGTRILGHDSAHAVTAPRQFELAGRRLPCDYRHRTSNDKGVPYAFASAHRSLADFLAGVDRVIRQARP